MGEDSFHAAPGDDFSSIETIIVALGESDSRRILSWVHSRGLQYCNWCCTNEKPDYGIISQRRSEIFHPII